MRALPAFAILCALPAAAAPLVLLFPAVGAPGGVTLSGRVLKHAPTGGSSTASRNLRWLTSSNWEGARVEVRFGGRSATVTTGHDGNFQVTLVPGDKRAFEPGLSTAEAHVDGAETGIATVDVIADAAPFFVVSDFDDTLAITNVAKAGGAIEAGLFKDSSTQPVVEGMAAFYGCLKEGKPARPVFALVSGSPVQYTPRITQFLARHGFPVFGQYLRDFGPKTLSGYKQPLIRALLQSLKQPVVLVGDSGEKDPEVYAQIRQEFPERVKAIYIREAGGPQDAKRFEGMLHFKHPAEAAADAVTKGLADAACVAGAFPAPSGTSAPGAQSDGGMAVKETPR
ncbi:MAG: App1 family protein [Myxococcota bacterium]